MEYLIKTYTNEGETVLDFTMGSGTTGVAAAELERRFIMIDNNPQAIEAMRTRLASVENVRYFVGATDFPSD